MIVGNEGVQVLAADLFFPLKDKLDVNGQPSLGSQISFYGLDVDEELALVIGRAAGVDEVVAHCRFKWRRLPQG